MAYSGDNLSLYDSFFYEFSLILQSNANPDPAGSRILMDSDSMQAGKNDPNGQMICFEECPGEQNDSPVSFLRKRYMAFLGFNFFPL